jgi:hypothetical protein
MPGLYHMRAVASRIVLLICRFAGFHPVLAGCGSAWAGSAQPRVQNATGRKQLGHGPRRARAVRRGPAIAPAPPAGSPARAGLPARTRVCSCQSFLHPSRQFIRHSPALLPRGDGGPLTPLRTKAKSDETTPSGCRASRVILRVQCCPRPSHSVDALSRKRSITRMAFSPPAPSPPPRRRGGSFLGATDPG